LTWVWPGYGEAPGDQLTQRLDSKPVMGTADYLSPGKHWQLRCRYPHDIYSMGATLLLPASPAAPLMITALSPKNYWPTSTQRARADHDLRPEVPPALAAVLKKMMAKKRCIRFQGPGGHRRGFALRTAGPIEPPAEEEMPKRCLALEALAAGTPSGPIPGAHYRTEQAARHGPAALCCHRATYCAKKMSPIKWLAEPKRRTPVVVGGGIAAVRSESFWFLVIARFSSAVLNEPSNNRLPKTNPSTPAGRRRKPPPTTTPNQAAPSGRPLPGSRGQKGRRKSDRRVPSRNTGATTTGRSLVFLNSSTARDKDNFTVVLDAQARRWPWKQAGISDAKSYYRSQDCPCHGNRGTFSATPANRG